MRLYGGLFCKRLSCHRHSCSYSAFRILPLLRRSISHDTFEKVGVPRDPKFKKVTEQDLDFFRSVLGDYVLTGEGLSQYNEDWLRRTRGKTAAVLFPKSTSDVSKILKYCNSNCIGVVPQGGNTSLVCGATPIHDEVVISLSKMDKIHKFDENSGILECDAGCILQNLDSWLQERQHCVPLDLAAKGSCQIGGNVATNAGGLHFVRYGSLRSKILSMEVVLPDGRVIEPGRALYKDNTGLDIKHLFIGSEGSLGIITKLVISTVVKPKYKTVTIMALDSYENAVKLLGLSRSAISESISAFELWDYDAARIVLEQLDKSQVITNNSHNYSFYVLLEAAANSEEYVQERVEIFLENALQSGIILDGVVAQDSGQQNEFWERREMITEATLKAGFCYKYDISTPIEHMYKLPSLLRDKLKSMGLYNGTKEAKVPYIASFGHVGDGNLHIAVNLKSGWSKEVEKSVVSLLFNAISECGGSISAEHGLGFNKPQYILFSKSKEVVSIMRSIKNILDPKGIMNPYKFLCDESMMIEPK